ncbi:tetratricopeptide repeat protein [Parafrankia discariae]|uniref:tetratricopeptide repeat protein n=1 Tax=Parafrankia discariae TaxID=365528 RepID=UPI000366B35E|nr:tetratricopeptide repeat protein [Parafrankia discariae]
MVTQLRATLPYVGLRPFEENEAGSFFGRDAEARSLSAAWLRSRLVIAHGPAGAGKTSLLRAGVLPDLAAADADILPVGRVDGPGLTAASPDALEPVVGPGNPFTRALLRCWSHEDESSSLLDALRDLTDRHHPRGASRPILLAIDQFEEFLAPRSARLTPLRSQFVEALAVAAAALPNLRILLVLRTDHREALLPYRRLLLAAGTAGADGPGHGSAVPVTEVAVTPLVPDCAVTALVEPLRAAGIRFAPGAAAACVDDLTTSRTVDATGAESLLVAQTVQPAFLQLVATALWRSRPVADVPVTASWLGPVGNVTAVLGEYLTRALVTTAHEHDLDEDELRAWLTRTFVTERGRRGMVDEGLTMTAGMPTPVLDALAERYVLRCEHRSGSRRFELFDDRLLEPLQRTSGPWPGTGGAATEVGAADYLRAAQVSFADGDLATACAHAEEALRRDPAPSLTRAGTQALRAQLYQAKGRLDQAEACLREAAEIYESLSDTEASGRVLASLGRLLLDAGQVGRAVEDLQAASERLSGDADVQSDLAHALWRAGQPWAAAAIFSAVLTIAPDAVAALAGRAQLRVDLGDDAGAVEDFDRLARAAAAAASGAGDGVELRAVRALALARLGRVAEASGESTTALRDAPDSGPVLWRVAEVIRAAGDEPGADDLLRRSLDATEPALAAHQRTQVSRLLRRSGALT